MDGTIDPNSIDQSTQIGQFTMLIAVLGILFSAAQPFLPKRRGGDKSRREILAERLELEVRNATIVREVNKNLSDWQLTARNLIRVLKNDLVASGGSISPQAENLESRLEEIDEREVDYGGDESG